MEDTKDTETTPLVKDNVPSTASTVEERTFNYRLLVMFPILGLYFYAIGIDIFGSAEYTHKTMKSKYFPNSSFNERFSACDTNLSRRDHKLHQKVQQESAEWILYFNLAAYLPATLASLVLGPLTDRYGRKFFLSLAIFGYAIRLTTWTVMSWYHLSLLYIVMGSFVFGACGGMYAIFALSFSIVSDVTEKGRKRTLFIVAVELFISSTISVSALVTGYFIKWNGYSYAWLLATCLAIGSFLLATFVLPESLKTPDASQKVSVISSAKRCMQFYTAATDSVTRRQYIFLILAFVFYAFSSLHRASIDTLYELGEPFCWTTTQVGWFGTMRTGVSNLASLLILFPLRRCFADDILSVLGTFTAIVSLIVQAFARTNVELYIMAVIGFPGKITIPVIRSLMSLLTPAEKQGALYASIGLVENLSSLLVSTIITMVYAATLPIMNGFVFLVVAFLATIAFVFLGGVVYLRRKHPDSTRS